MEVMWEPLPHQLTNVRVRRAGKGSKEVIALGVLSLIILALWVGGVAINRIEDQPGEQSE
jgi:hypothetical protein